MFSQRLNAVLEDRQGLNPILELFRERKENYAPCLRPKLCLIPLLDLLVNEKKCVHHKVDILIL